MKNTPYRSDIDWLRGLAIIVVVGFHYFPRYFVGGFSGVDIFFVISGYLITKIIYRENSNGVFRFKDFYGRRIKRIFPALIATLLAAFFLGYVFLLPNEFKELNKNIIAASTFTTNILLIREQNGGYFNPSAIDNPLIHLWSLGIEEQFYIFWPLIVIISIRAKKEYALIALLILFVFFDFSQIFKPYIDTYGRSE